jgi:exonuclease SbcD
LAIQGIFGVATEVKLEGRVIPVVRARAAGISQHATIAAKIAVWARLTEARAEPLLGCLEALQTHPPEEIAADIIEGAIEAQGAIPAAAEGDIDASVGMTADAEGLPVLV